MIELPEKLKASVHFFSKLQGIGEKSALRDACEYALTTGGKRLRPLVVYLVADALGHGIDVSSSAVSAEFFHTASLIADDLPCMDDDTTRRGKPCFHIKYSVVDAKKLSNKFILDALGLIYRNLSRFPNLIKIIIWTLKSRITLFSN